MKTGREIATASVHATTEHLWIGFQRILSEESRRIAGYTVYKYYRS